MIISEFQFNSDLIGMSYLIEQNFTLSSEVVITSLKLHVILLENFDYSNIKLRMFNMVRRKKILKDSLNHNSLPFSTLL